MRQVEIALSYARAGVPVFPVTSEKRPAPMLGRDGGHYLATTDEATIRRWWRKNPNLLIASPTTSFCVLDVDVQKADGPARVLLENALHQLFIDGISEDAVLVDTAGGGYHMYFAPIPEARRQIKVLPYIDFLASGDGYVVLPDQKTYVAEKPLWENISSLPEFPYAKIQELSGKLKQQTRISLDADEKISARVEQKTKKKRTFTKPDWLTKDSIDYKTGEIVQKQVEQMYDSVSEYESDASILSRINEESFTLTVSEGDLNSKNINALFHHPPLQKFLATWLGVDVPDGDRNVQHSIIPGHLDVRPSMGVRWSRHKTHLLIRDFSNHFGDSLNQLDYNLVRMYATIRYNTLAPRLKAPEFVVWFLRMCIESGFLVPDFKLDEYSVPANTTSGSIHKVAEGFLLLHNIKRFYEGYDGTSVFSDKFAAAWCGVSPLTANRAKKEIVREGYVDVVGICDCSGGSRTDGFFNSNIYKVVSINKKTNNLEAPK